MSVNFSANGKEIKRTYDSILNGDSSFEWALYGYEDRTNELELVDSGCGLEKLSEEFDEDEYQYAFVRVNDPNTNLPKFVFISWCGESVPFIKKGRYNANTNDILRFFDGFHIHINARSKFDVDPDEIMKKVKSCSGANYSYHEKEAAKSNLMNDEPKIELKAEANKSSEISKFPSLYKSNPLNDQKPTNTIPKENPLNSSKADNTEESKSYSRRSSNIERRRSNIGYNPLQPSSSRRNSILNQENSVGNIKDIFEIKNNNSKEDKEEFPKVSTDNNVNRKMSAPSNEQTPVSASDESSNISPTHSSISRRSSMLRRRSSVDYNPLQPNASRKNSIVKHENSVGNFKLETENAEKKK